MTVHWLPVARRLAAEGRSLSAIGAAVGRSKVAVWRQLRGKRSAQDTSRARRRPSGPEAVRRGAIRGMARAEAAATGEPVDAIYRRWDVVALDRSRVWDETRRGG